MEHMTTKSEIQAGSSQGPSEREETIAEHEPFGEQLYGYRTRYGMSQAALAARAGVSKSYLSEIENGRRLPPPRRTAVRLTRALALTRCEADRLVASAVVGRGTERPDAELPSDVRQLITDLRVYAFRLPVRFVVALRKSVKEIVM